MKRVDLWLLALLSVLLVVASWRRWMPYELTETLGFVTGAACVYLVVKESIWNFPLGIANNIFFLVLFVSTRLYADAGLQIVYIVLGVQGWHLWLRGGEHRSALHITRASGRLLAMLGLLVLVCTAGLMVVLRLAKGSAPVMDSFTTVLSLAAQYLLNSKKIENWFVWILADVIYVWLYLSRGLHLTAILYSVFLILCVAGWVNWRRILLLRQTGGPALNANKVAVNG
jgi:nicotinamide mononucleotide transporter